MTKPCVAEVIPENIPNEIRLLERWVVWRYELSDEKWEKVPIGPATGRKADITNAATWVSFEDAFAYYRRAKMHGVGFVLAAGAGYVGIDLDECYDPETGAVQPWATSIM